MVTVINGDLGPSKIDPKQPQFVLPSHLAAVGTLPRLRTDSYHGNA